MTGLSRLKSGKEIAMKKEQNKYLGSIWQTAGIILAACMALLVFPLSARAENPIVQTVYTADPAPLAVGDTLYVYTSHDEDGSDWYIMKDWKCYSTKDMVNWTDHGTVLSLEDFSWAIKDAWAAQCVERNGKYYMYVPVTYARGTAIGVAVADSPTGPFRDPIGEPLVRTGVGDIDPTVFVDDDGQAYLYWGNPNLYYVKLNENMTSYDKSGGNMGEGFPGITKVNLTPEGFGEPKEPDRESMGIKRTTSYEEAPWFYKRGNLYYMIYAANMPEDLAYATSSSPTGPWKYGGIIMNGGAEGGTNSFTNHPGIVDFKGKSYLFYHTAHLSGGSGFTRSVAVEEFTYGSDGSIPLITCTSKGVNAIKTLDPYVRNEAETIAQTAIEWDKGVKKGIQTESHMEGEQRCVHVCNIHNGDSIKVANVDFGTKGAAAFTAKAACVQGLYGSTAGGSIELWIDADNAANKKKIGELSISYSNGEYMDFITNITEAVTGSHDLTFLFKGQDNSELFLFDSWQFIAKSEGNATTIALKATLDRHKIDITEGKNKAVLTVKAIKSDGTEEDVTNLVQVTGLNGQIASYEKGQFTGKTYGKTTASITYDGKQATLPILVRNEESEVVESLDIKAAKETIEAGKSAKVTVLAVFKDGHKEDITEYAVYENLTPLYISFENNRIKGIGKGTGRIRATFAASDGKSVSAEVQVEVIAPGIMEIELIKNGDFSDGTNNWKTNYGTNGISVKEDENGGFYLEVASRSNNYSGPYQAVAGDFKAGDVLHFSFRMKSANQDNTEKPRFNVKYLDGDKKGQESQVVSKQELKNEWITITGEYQIEADTTKLEFYIHESPWNDSVSTFYLADVSVRLQVKISEELIKNGDFSDGTNNWRTNYGANNISVKEDGNGEFYLEVASRSNNYSGPVQAVAGNFKAGDVLHYSFRMKSANADNKQQPRFNVKYLDGDKEGEEKAFVNAQELKNEWIVVTGEYQIEADATGLEFYIHEGPAYVTDVSTFYLADVSVRLQTAVAPATLTGITVKTAPTKVSYKVGEELDLHGMVLTATYSDNSTKEITDTKLVTTSGYDKSKEGTQTVTVSYEGKTATFQVTVTEEDKEEVNKNILKAVIERPKNLRETDYTAASWKAMQAALTTAKEALGSETVTQQEVNTATEALRKALEALVWIDKSGLRAAIDRANEKIEVNYTATSWKAMQAALTTARAVAGNADAVQTEIDDATRELSEALRNLEEKKVVNKNTLSAAIDRTKNLKEANYTAASWRVMQAALAKANEALESGTVSQAEVDVATAALREALAELVWVDKSGLKAAIDRAGERKETNYTDKPDEWAAMQAALVKANEVAENADALQKEVDDAAYELSEALRALDQEGSVNKNVLSAAIERKKNLKETDYTATSWAVLQEALKRGNEAMESETVTQEEVNAATMSLREAFAGLVWVDRFGLRAVIDRAGERTEADYTAASWAAMQAALAKANTVAENGDALQKEIDDAAFELSEALRKLERKKEINKNALSAAIDRTKELKETDYTAASWAAMQTALAKAKEVAENGDALQKEVDDAAYELSEALRNLKYTQQDETAVKVKKISISGLSKKIAAGKKVKLEAKIIPSNASDKGITWKSSNKKIATVNSKGVVTMNKNSGGKSVTITAVSKDGSKVKATYKIKSMKGKVTKVTISGKKKVKAGKTLKLTGKVNATKGANKTLKWKSSNKRYATVDSKGKVKALKAGKGKKVKITAMATDGSGKKKVVTIEIAK